MSFKTDYRLMQVKSIAEHSAILSTFIKLPVVIKTFVLSIFEWSFYTGFTVFLDSTRKYGLICKTDKITWVVLKFHKIWAVSNFERIKCHLNATEFR